MQLPWGHGGIWRVIAVVAFIACAGLCRADDLPISFWIRVVPHADMYESIALSAAATEDVVTNAKPLAGTQVTLGDWYSVGPFPSTKETVLTEVFPPEQGVDLEASYGEELAWRQQPTWDRNGYYQLSKTDYSVTYVYRTVEVKEDGDFYAGLGCSDVASVWVDGGRIPTSQRSLGTSAYAEVLVIPLTAGTHTLLIRVASSDRDSGFVFTPVFELGTRPTEQTWWHAMLAMIERQRPNHEASLLYMERQSGMLPPSWRHETIAQRATRYTTETERIARWIPPSDSAGLSRAGNIPAMVQAAIDTGNLHPLATAYQQVRTAARNGLQARQQNEDRAARGGTIRVTGKPGTQVVVNAIRPALNLGYVVPGDWLASGRSELFGYSSSLPTSKRQAMEDAVHRASSAIYVAPSLGWRQTQYGGPQQYVADIADAAAAWATEHRMRLRLSPLFGQDNKPPSWFTRLDEEAKQAALLQRTEAAVRAVGHPERVLDLYHIGDKPDPIVKALGDAAIVAIYRRAREIAPDQPLGLAVSGLLGSRQAEAAMLARVKALIDAGAPIDELCVMLRYEHVIDPFELYGFLTRVAAVVPRITVARLEIESTDPNAEGTLLREFLAVATAHPSVQGVYLHPFADSRKDGGEHAAVDDSMRERPKATILARFTMSDMGSRDGQAIPDAGVVEIPVPYGWYRVKVGASEGFVELHADSRTAAISLQ